MSKSYPSVVLDYGARIEAAKTRVRRHRMLPYITLIAISYWYCLPVVTQSLFSYNEFRAYDFLLLGLIGTMLFRYRVGLQSFLAKDRPGRWLFRLASWATLSSLMTVITALWMDNVKWIGVTAVFLFHLWGFIFAYAAFRMFVRSRSQALRLLDLFLVLGGLEALLVCLQGVGIVGRLWGERYDVYGTMAYSGTLGPNRTLPGHAFILILAVALGYWRNSAAVGPVRLALAAVSGILAVLGIGLAGSRTAWVVAIVFGLGVLFAGRLRIGVLVFIAVVAMGILAVTPTRIDESISEMYDYRLTVKLERAEDGDLKERFTSVDAGRLKLWTQGIAALGEHAYVIPFGCGFNNYRYAMHAGVSAHNAYITVTAELGVVGLFLYIMWLKAIVGETGRRIRQATLAGQKHRRVFVPSEMRALVLAMLVSLTAGEILYPYRPTFSFLGMFLMISALLNHKVLRGPGEVPEDIAEASPTAPNSHSIWARKATTTPSQPSRRPQV
ncbi:MAG: O-antigen ligase family protein [Chthonomonadales bacterium]